MGELSERLYVDEYDLDEAINILDRNSIDNDLDEGNRIMLAEEDVEEALELLEDAGLGVDVI